MAMTAPQLHVHVETLVLRGVAPGDPRVTQAVERAARQALAAQPRAASYAKPGAIANAIGAAVTKRAPR
jgi:hypothetical protein